MNQYPPSSSQPDNVGRGFGFGVGIVLAMLCAVFAFCGLFGLVTRAQDVERTKALTSRNTRYATRADVSKRLSDMGFTWEGSEPGDSASCRSDKGCVEQWFVFGLKNSGPPRDVVLTFYQAGRNPYRAYEGKTDFSKMFSAENVTILWDKDASYEDESALLSAIRAVAK